MQHTRPRVMRLGKLTASLTWRLKDNLRVKGANGCADMKGAYALMGMQSGGLVQPCRRGRSTGQSSVQVALL